jgi:hypothetical protein
MKPFSQFLTGLFLVLVLTEVAQAQSYQITSVQAIGAGCPQGSVSATLAPDLSAISILFDRFSVSANKGSQSGSLLRKGCQFVFGVTVSPGYNLEATSLQYRGFAQLPNSVTATITTSGPIMQKSRFIPNANMVTSVIGSMIDNFFVEQKIFQDFKNTCQQQTKIQFNTNIQLNGRQNRFTMIFPEDSQLVIDSLDSGPSSSAIELGIRLTPCH